MAQRFLKEPPFPRGTVGVGRSRLERGEGFLPLCRLPFPREMFEERVPPTAVKRGRIIHERTQRRRLLRRLVRRKIERLVVAAGILFANESGGVRAGAGEVAVVERREFRQRRFSRRAAFFLEAGGRFGAGLGGVGQGFENRDARFVFAAAQKFQLRVIRHAAGFGREERAIEREHEGVARAGERDVKQALHFLAAQELVGGFVFLFAIFLVQGGDDFVAARDADERRITRRRLDDAAAEKRHDDGVPLQAFRLVRGDELDGVFVGKTNRALVFHFAAEPLREIGEPRAGGARLRRRA